MAVNRVWKEYKELCREAAKSGPDKEISLEPVDDSSVFEWNVSALPRPSSGWAPIRAPSTLATPRAAVRKPS